MKTIRLNKKQQEIIDPLNKRAMGLRGTLSDLVMLRGMVDEEMLRALYKLFPKIKAKAWIYDTADKTLEIEEE